MEKSSEKRPGWLLPPVKGNILRAGLYVVATPIGNLGDITLRALDVLAGVDFVICEDTRVSGKLLSYYGIKKPLVSYNDHNAGQKRDDIIKRIKQGASAAIISDAGTPLISDPGYKLTKACMNENLYVTALPGASAVMAGLTLSAQPTDAFCFIGFLPSKTGARKKELARWKNTHATLIAFETAPRLVAALGDIHEILGNREVAVAREITKMFEESRRGHVLDLINHYETAGAPKGEIVLVIGAAVEGDEAAVDMQALLKKAMKTMSLREAATHVAVLTGKPRKDIYNLALKIRAG
jgi:16S rRNA (cytidine1402-2'-O)-methyltransferase